MASDRTNEKFDIPAPNGPSGPGPVVGDEANKSAGQGWLSALRSRLGLQGADGCLAMIPQQFDRLGDEFASVFFASRTVALPQPDQHLCFGLFAHVVVHTSGNTHF